MLSLKNVVTARGLVVVANNFIVLVTSSFSFFNPPSTYFPSIHTFQAMAASQLHLKNVETKEVADSFKEWFKSGNNTLFDRIYSILSDQDVGDPAYIIAADSALSQLDLPLSEKFVLEVLRYGIKSHCVLSCLKFFDWAGRQRGFEHTPPTFYAIFNIMSRAKGMLDDYLDDYVKKKDDKFRFYDVLVIGYAVAGKPGIALQMFCKMRFKGLDLDAFAYHVLLNALVDQNWFDAVKVILKQMSRRGLENNFTRSTMVKSLCKQNRLEEGEAFIRDMVKWGHDLSGYMVGHLVDALCRNNRFGDAGRLIEEFRGLGMVQVEQCYNTWVKNLVWVGKVDDALEFLKTKMVLERYVPDAFHFNLLISRLLRENRVQEVSNLLVEMKDGNIVPDKVTMNATLCFFCKAGMDDVVIALYNSGSEFGLSPNSKDKLINTLCADGSIEEAYSILKKYFYQGYFPAKRSFSILAEALCKVQKIDDMKELLIIALERNFEPNASTYTLFISTLCRAGKIEDAYLIHTELNKVGNVAHRTTYLDLLLGLCCSQEGCIAAKLVIEMQEKGHIPTRTIFRHVIECMCCMHDSEKYFFEFLELQLSYSGHLCKAYNFFIDGARHVRRPDLGLEVFEMMCGNGIQPDLDSVILLLQCFLTSSNIPSALAFFSSFTSSGTVDRKLYNAMIIGLCKLRVPEEALKIFREAMDSRVGISRRCHEQIVRLLCSIEQYEEMFYIIVQFWKAKGRISSYMGNTLLLYSSRRTRLYISWVELTKFETSPYFRMLGCLIGIFSGYKTLNPHVEDVENAMKQCFPLSLVSYNIMLGKLISIDQIDNAYKLFYSLGQKGFYPNQWTYITLAWAFYKHGNVAEAKKIMEEMSRIGFVRWFVRSKEIETWILQHEIKAKYSIAP